MDIRLKKCGECFHWRVPSGQNDPNMPAGVRPCMEGPPCLLVTTMHPISKKPLQFVTFPTRNQKDDACGRFQPTISAVDA